MKLTLTIIAFSITICIVFGQSDVLRKSHFNTKKNVAIEGYDPVSYFDGNPVEGNPDINISFKNITYYFVSTANKNKFKITPEHYEPAYGGWCAYAMGDSGEKVKIDPETFKILNGTLYLFYNFWGNNTLDKWNANEKKLKYDADHNWTDIVR